MKYYRVKHKYCGMERIVKGKDLLHALRNGKLDSKIWHLVTD